MYKHAETTEYAIEHKIGLIKQLLAILPQIEPLIQHNELSKENLDAACQLLGIALSEFDQRTQDEKDAILLQVKRDAWLLFHPDKYVLHTEVQDDVRALFHLIDPAIDIVKDFLANSRNYHFAAEELAEMYWVRPPRDMSLIQFPDIGLAQHRDNRAKFWKTLLNHRTPIILRKDRSTLLQQYQHLFPNFDLPIQNDTQTETISPANLFYELFRQGAIDFVHDCDDMLTVLSSLPSQIAKEIVHSEQFLRCHRTRFDYFVNFLNIFEPTRKNQDAIFYALQHFPQHISASLLESYIAHQHNKGCQPHLLTKDQRIKSCEKLIVALRERNLLKAVMGGGLGYLMRHNAPLAREVFVDLEWLLQLRENDKLYAEWNEWERTVLDLLQACGVTDPSHLEILMAVMHPNSCELEIFDTRHIQSVYEQHQTNLPLWVGQRLQYAQRLASRLIQTEQLALSTTTPNYFSEAQLVALNRFCLPHRFKYTIRGEHRSIEILQPQLQAWLKDFTQGKGNQIFREEFKLKLDQQCARYFSGEQTQYDLATLRKLYAAIDYTNDFNWQHRNLVKDLSNRFDEQLLSDNHDLSINEATISAIVKQLQRIDAASEYTTLVRVWQLTLRAVVLRMLYRNNGHYINEFQVDEQKMYLIEMGIQPRYTESYDNFGNMHDNFERRTSQLTNLQSVFNVCRKLGGISEFINLTQRLLPGLSQTLHGEPITSWATISEALDKVFTQRIRCVLNNKPLQLSFYSGRHNLFDSAEIIMTAILATHPELANQSQLQPEQFIEAFIPNSISFDEVSTNRLTC